MKQRIVSLGIAIVALTLLAGPCMAQAPPEWPDKEKFDAMIGTWTFENQWRLSPDGDWQKLTGEAKFQWILGGAFLEARGKTDLGTSVEILGYDPLQKTYINFGFDSGGTRWHVTSANFSGTTWTVNVTVVLPDGMEIPSRCVTEMNADYTATTGECEFFAYGKWWVGRKFKETKVK